MNLSRGWYRYLYPAWNLIPSVLHSMKFDSKEGRKVLRVLRQPGRAGEVAERMRVFGFRMNDDPVLGFVSMRQRPWVTCARKVGSCEDFARLWSAVLCHPKGKVEYLYTRSMTGQEYVLAVYTLGGVSWLLDGPRVAEEVFESKKSVLLRYKFGDKTEDSCLY